MEESYVVAEPTIATGSTTRTAPMRIMNMSSIDPLEIWNRRIDSSGYESIPDSTTTTSPANNGSPTMEISRRHFGSSTNAWKQTHVWPCQQRRSTNLVVGCLVMVVVVLLGVLFVENASQTSSTSTTSLKTNWITVPGERPHFVPTLLQVVDTTQNYVNALNNPLYNEMLSPNTRYLGVDETSLAGNELPQLLLDKTSLDTRRIVHNRVDEDDETLTIAWTAGCEATTGQTILKDDDILALYCGYSSDNSMHEAKHGHGGTFLEAATIAQVRVTSLQHGGRQDAWLLPSFPVLRQDECHFRLYQSSRDGSRLGDTNPDGSSGLTLVHLASSELIVIRHAKDTPSAIHLALTNDPSKMTVQFTTGLVEDVTKGRLVPVVRYSKVRFGTKEDDQRVLRGTTETYTADDMCQYPANQSEAGKFYPPGALHTVELKGLEPSTLYEYQVGLMRLPKVGQEEEVLVWSEPSQFTSVPSTGSHRNGQKPFSFIVYGDQGLPANHHCQDGKMWMQKMMERSGDKPPIAVHHFGDISYANGAAHIWDEWFGMISPFSTSIPLMVSIGNHEYDHTDGGIGKDPSGVKTADGYRPPWGDFMEDSGGECGVAMAKRFRMPSSKFSNGVFWYSYDHASVHTVVVSSEHDLSRGSPQFAFLEHDLKTVDRSKTPWVILESHRPLYEGEGGGHWVRNMLVGEAMRHEIEDLLYDYDVDVLLGGHYHEYHRTCDRVYKGECNAPSGPMHITVGAAGGALDDFYPAVYNNSWTARYLRGVFGYGQINIANDTALNFQFIGHDDGAVLDDVWVLRER